MACVLAAVAAAQNTPPSVKLNPPLVVAAGKPFNAVLTVTFAPGLHGYQNPPSDPSLIPVSVTFVDKTFQAIHVKYPKGTPEKVGGDPKPVSVYEGAIKIPVVVTAPTKLGKTTLKLAFSYQQCTDRTCFQPSSINVQADVLVVKNLPPTKAAAVPKGNG